MTNGARVEYLNRSHYFADEVCGVAGTTGIAGNANAKSEFLVYQQHQRQMMLLNSVGSGVGIATGTVVSHDSGLVLFLVRVL